MTPEEALTFIDNVADGGLGAPDYAEAISIVRGELVAAHLLHTRVAELEAALGFYADLDNYEEPGIPISPAPLLGPDCGLIARSALTRK